MPSEERLNSGTCRDFEQGVCVCVCVQPCDPRENFFSTFLCSHVYKQGAVTEIVRSLPMKTLTFSGDALEDVPVCTCKQRDGPLCHPRLAKGPCGKISVSGRFSRFFFFQQVIACGACQSHSVAVVHA